MTVDEYKLFPTLVTRVSDVLTARQCADAFAYIKTLKMFEHTALEGDAKSTFENGKSHLLQQIALNVRSCKNICADIALTVSDYATRTQMQVEEIGNSWASVQDKDSRLTKHTHPLSVVSGVLYIKVDADSSKLHLYNPNPFIKFTPYTKLSEFNFNSFWFAPKIGEVILFPSWMLHDSGGEFNQTKDRTIISFNTA